MPALAELLGRADADRLAALKAELQRQPDQPLVAVGRDRQADGPATSAHKERQLEAAEPTAAAVCGTCGQRLPVPAVIFRSGAERD